MIQVVSIIKRYESLDWNKIVEKAALNSVLPNLYYNLKNLSLEEEISIPIKVMEIFKAAYNYSVACNIVNKDVLTDIFKACNELKIKVMPTKGVILSEMFYPDENLRVMRDIDLFFVKKDFMEKKNDLLNNLPKLHVIKSRSVAIEALAIYGVVNAIMHFHMAWGDLGLWESEYESDRIWSRAKNVEFNGFNVSIMSSEDLLLMGCYHSFGHSRINLRDLCDAYVITNIEAVDIDWDYIFRTAQRTSLAVPVYCTLRLIFDLYGNEEIPMEMLKKFELSTGVKLFNFILKTWSARGGFFEYALLLSREITRIRSLGFFHVLHFYKDNWDTLVRSFIGMIKNRRYEITTNEIS